MNENMELQTQGREQEWKKIKWCKRDWIFLALIAVEGFLIYLFSRQFMTNSSNVNLYNAKIVILIAVVLLLAIIIIAIGALKLTLNIGRGGAEESDVMTKIIPQIVNAAAILGAAVIATIGVFNFSAAKDDRVTASGTWKSPDSQVFSWSVTSAGVLKISGSGPTGNMKRGDSPWKKSLMDITSIEISSGITEIGRRLFADCSQARSVTLADSVKTIGDHAFSGCSNLESIAFPETVESIHATAFDYCSNIKSFSVAEGNKVYLDKSGVLYKRDENPKRLILVHYPPAKIDKTYTIEPETYLIAEDAFCCCKLEKISIPDTVKFVRRFAFEKQIGNTLTVEFLGDAPVFLDTKGTNEAFAGTTATVYYPAQKNNTWKRIAKEQPQYGGTVTWKPE